MALLLPREGLAEDAGEPAEIGRPRRIAVRVRDSASEIHRPAVREHPQEFREALGEEQVSYFGFSYGTYLGMAYRGRYPERVRAMVLDGVVMVIGVVLLILPPTRRNTPLLALTASSPVLVLGS